jgi:hypothetical protein
MATVDLGKIRFNWTGAYNNSTAYVPNDCVSSSGNSYICKLASTGNAVSNGTYWDLMSSAGTNGADGTNGTNGTDLGTVLTTESDIVYRDGSGLQRLAKGTASQQLRMNSGATAPEWFTPGSSGPFEVLASGTTTNGAFELTNVADAGFKVATHLRTATGGGGVLKAYFSANNGSSYITSGYRYGTAKLNINGQIDGQYNGSNEGYMFMGLTGAFDQTFSVDGMDFNSCYSSISSVDGRWAYTNAADSGLRLSYGEYPTNQTHNAIKFDWNGTKTIDYVAYKVSV